MNVAHWHMVRTEVEGLRSGAARNIEEAFELTMFQTQAAALEQARASAERWARGQGHPILGTDTGFVSQVFGDEDRDLAFDAVPCGGDYELRCTGGLRASSE